jgi:5-methylcytosine-specific restriction endonuclease McrA
MTELLGGARVSEALESPARAADAAARAEKRIRSWYNGWEWKRCRYNFILKNKERKCACCNSTAAHGERMVVAHIKPIRKHFHLRAAPDNLMWLCDSCNRGMGSHDETDWRADKIEAHDAKVERREADQ